MHAKVSWIGRRALLATALVLGVSPLAPAQAALPAPPASTPVTAATTTPTTTTTEGAPRGAEVVAVKQVADRLTDLIVRSQALGGRTVNVRLLTPDGSNPPTAVSTGRRSGCCTGAATTTRPGPAPTREDHRLHEVLVVMPEAGRTAGTGTTAPAATRPGRPSTPSNSLTSSNTTGARARRVVAGLSMGGQAHSLYAARHPGMFRAVAAYSGSAHPLLNDESVHRIMGFFAGQGNDPLRVWGDPVAQRSIWEAHDPYYLAHRLKSLPVYLSCGDGTAGPFDPPGKTDALEADFNRQNHALAAQLEQAGAKHLTTNFYGPGTHAWSYWQRELHASLPILLQALNVH